MKTLMRICLVLVAVMGLTVTGCSKKEEPKKAPETKDVADAAKDAADDAADAAKDTVDAAKDAADDATE